MLPTASWRQSGVLPNALDLLPSPRPASRWTGKRRDERLGHLDETADQLEIGIANEQRSSLEMIASAPQINEIRAMELTRNADGVFLWLSK